MATKTKKTACTILTGGLIVAMFTHAYGQSSNAIAIPLIAEFEHSAEIGLYKTFLSSRHLMKFVQDESGITGNLLLAPDRCIAVASWETLVENSPKTTGPAILCIVNTEIDEQQLQLWLERGDKSSVDPAAIIPVEIGDSGQNGQQIWVNSFPVMLQVYYRTCLDGEFQKFATLDIDPKKLSFYPYVDSTFQNQLEVVGQSLQLNIDPMVWDTVRQCLGTDDLPSMSALGTSVSFAGTSVPPPLDPKTIFAQYSELRGLVFIASQIGGLSADDASKLHKQLDKLNGALRSRIEDALKYLDKFSDDIGKLLSKGLMTADIGEQLIEASDVMQEALNTQRTFPEPLPLEPEPLGYCPASDESCPVVGDCVFTTFYVDDDSDDPEADGSRSRPFPDIVDALAAAGKSGLCGVTIQVESGTYFGDLNILQHTNILGPAEPGLMVINGSIVTTGPYQLQIDRANLLWFEDEPANGVFTDHPCAQVVITNSVVRGYRGYGIRQRGGTLGLGRTTVAETAALPDFLTHGTGVYLSCGVQALAQDLALIDNESSALHLWGEDTRMTVFNLQTTGTGAHPVLETGLASQPPRGTGAVHVRGRAQLNVIGFNITNNVMFGVHVATGGRIAAADGRVSNTRSLDSYFCTSPTDPCPTSGRPFGHNVVAVSGGRLSVVNFDVVGADACGALLASAGEADFRGGPLCSSASPTDCSYIASNPVGICLQVPGYDRSRLLDGVRFDPPNDRDLEETDLPVPEPSDPIGLGPEEPTA